MIKNKDRPFMRRGAGEFIGAAVVMPFIFAIILFIVNYLQISICEQKLIYAAYTCGREAVISFDQSEAQTNANNALAQIFKNDEDVSVTISSGGAGWIKGNIIGIIVEENLHPVLGIQSGVHSRRVAMMIEHSKWTDEIINY